mgnify:FL=1
MAFLDNSGDIILDAILTSTGRKRMAQGKFRITKYALGDDEINYSLYNKNHPSGGAYYDLEILQTPVKEATDAGINYGLTSHTRTDLLYMPEIKVNKLLNESSLVTGNVHVLSTNQETTEKLKAVFGKTSYILEAGSSTSTKLIVEMGIDSPDLAQTKENQRSYLGATNLIDKSLYVYADSRFINNVLGPPKTATFTNTTDGKVKVNFGSLKPSSGTSVGFGIKNYSAYVVATVPNNITENSAVDVSAYTAVRGPKSAASAINLAVPVELMATSTGVSDIKYALYGTQGEALYGGSNLYDYIDTTVYLEGTTTSARAQVSIRIIRYAGT